jgi:hypothetical protein
MIPTKQQREEWRRLAEATTFRSAVGEYTPEEFIELLDAIDVVESCRDHWKTSFEHERENVIRLRRLLAGHHAAKYYRNGGQCVCDDCALVRAHAEKPEKR